MAWLLRLWLVLWATSIGSIATAQLQEPPAAWPDVLRGGIQPDAIYMMTEEGYRVMTPDMTLEELERLLKVDGGYAQPLKPYTFEGITIEGTAEEERAELAVTVKLNVSPTPGQWVSIPLEMQGFHRLGPADVAGVERYQMDLDLDRGGYMLWVQAEQARKVEVRMRVVTRVVADAGPAIEFRLPTAPTTVNLSVRGEGLSALAVGRGDEVVRVADGEPGRTRVEVESGGGNFTLSWRVRDERRPSEQVLEVDSRLRLSWDDPQSPPLVVAEMDVNNRRGNIGPFEVVFPEGAELVEPLPSTPALQVTSRDVRSGRIQVVPDEGQQLSRVKFSIEYRLPSGDYGSENPLHLRPGEIPGAIRHAGEIEVRTDRNFRLRWLQQPLVRSAWRTTVSDSPETRVYRFQFDRVPFELPLWLAAKQQRLQVEHEYVIRVGETAVTMEATLQASGTVIEGVPLIIDAPGWQTVEVKDAETGLSIDDPLGEQGNGLELELGELTPNGSSAVGVRWTAARAIDPEQDSVGFNLPTIRLPTIQSADQRIVSVSKGTLHIGAEDGLALITDIEKCVGLTRDEMAAAERGSRMQSFTVEAVGAAPRYEGFLSEDRPEASIDPTVEVAVTEQSLRVATEWLVTPRGSLRGRLPVELPESSSVEQWEASVDGLPALLREQEDGEVVLYSDDLDRLPRRVRLVSLVPLPELPPRAADGQDRPAREVEIALPEPALEGGTISGPAAVRTLESPGYEVSVVDSEQASDIDSADGQSLRVEVRLRPPQVAERQVVERAVMHSEINRTRRYDRLVALVVGGEDAWEFRFLPLGDNQEAADMTIRVYVDGEEISDFDATDGRVSIPIDSPETPHVVDLRMWRRRDGGSMAEMVEPVWKLPVSSGKTYWDITLASDRHLIWSSPAAREMMQWRYDRLFVRRVASRSYSDLLRWVGAEPRSDAPLGNRYLLVTADPGGVRFYEAGRPILWASVACITLLVASLLFYIPRLRHPLAAIAAALAVGGLTLLAPNLAVIAGQLLIASIGLVAVMIGVHAIVTRRPRATVFGGATVAREPSTLRRGPVNGDVGSARLQETVPGSAAGARG